MHHTGTGCATSRWSIAAPQSTTKNKSSFWLALIWHRRRDWAHSLKTTRLTDTFTHKWPKRPLGPLANITATQRFVFYHVYKSQKAILHHNAPRQIRNRDGDGVRVQDGVKEGGYRSWTLIRFVPKWPFW